MIINDKMRLYMKEHVYILPEEIGDGRIDSIVEILDHLKNFHDRKREIVFNLEKVKRVTPSGMAILCCLADSLREQSRKTHTINLNRKTAQGPFIQKLLNSQSDKSFIPIN